MYFIIKKLGCRLVIRKSQHPPGRGDVEGVASPFYIQNNRAGVRTKMILPILIIELHRIGIHQTTPINLLSKLRCLNVIL